MTRQRLLVCSAELRRGEVPSGLTGVRWPDGTIECRFRVTHPNGSLVADDDENGEVLYDSTVECDRCSDACA
jgi:hypothetical protein